MKDQGRKKPQGLSHRTLSALQRQYQDQLIRNSLYLTLSTATMAVLGFAFWLLSARLYTPGQIGRATALISAVALISQIGLFGFNNTFIRFLPSSRQRDTDISTGLLVVLAAAALTATMYIFVVPYVAPKLNFVRHSPGLAIGFIVFATFSAANLVTDSVFIAYRKTQYNLLVDGFIQGLTKLVLPIALIGLGAYGIFAASGLAATVAIAASLFFMVKRLGFRPKLGVSFGVLKQTWEFSAANYLANLLNLTPIFAIPLIVLDTRGASQTGYFFVSFQIANLLNAVGYSVSSSLLAEGSYEDSDLATLLRKSARVMALISVPTGILVAITARWLLMVFGATYSRHAASTLAVLALATPSVAFYVWSTTILRITKQLRALIGANIVYGLTIVGLALYWAHRGLVWIAIAWLIGNLLSGGIAALAAFMHMRTSMRPAGFTERQPGEQPAEQPRESS